MLVLAGVLDLKLMLTSLSKDDHEAKDDYLRTVKTIADSLAAIQSSVSNLELIQYIIAMLQHSSEYEGFLTA